MQENYLLFLGKIRAWKSQLLIEKCRSHETRRVETEADTRKGETELTGKRCFVRHALAPQCGKIQNQFVDIFLSV